MRYLPRIARLALGALLLFPAAAASSGDTPQAGRIYLVGMGPGDSDLVTLKTAKLLAAADRVYCFDYVEATVRPLVEHGTLTVASPLLMARWVRLNPDQVEGEARQKVLDSGVEQARFVDELRTRVAAGETVVLADAGDPTLFCPWTWILARLPANAVTILPGLSSFNAANAAIASDVVGRNSAMLLSCGEELGQPNAAGRLETTLVFFVHRINVHELVPRLLARYPVDTPVVIVSEAGYAERQRVLRGTLATILRTLDTEKLSPLHLVYVGDGLTASTDSMSHCPCGKEK